MLLYSRALRVKHIFCLHIEFECVVTTLTFLHRLQVEASFINHRSQYRWTGAVHRMESRNNQIMALRDCKVRCEYCPRVKMMVDERNFPKIEWNPQQVIRTSKKKCNMAYTRRTLLFKCCRWKGLGEWETENLTKDGEATIN